METETLTDTQWNYPQHISSLRESLLAQEKEVSQAYLTGVSGEAFRFFYCRLDPLRGHRVFLQNPLRSACSALGYKYTVHYDRTPTEALDRLKDHLDQKQDVIIETEEDCPLIRHTYRPQQVLRVHGKREEIPVDILMRRWHPIEGMFELGPTGYYQFVVEEQDRSPNEKEAALGALRRAIKMLKGTRRIQGCAMGLEAFEELEQHLYQLSKTKVLTETQMERIVMWGDTPLNDLIRSRNYAMEYVQQIQAHFDEEERELLEKAVETYQDLLETYQELVEVFPEMPEEIEYAEDERAPNAVNRSTAVPFKKACRKASKVVGKVMELESDITEAFLEVKRISERTKM